MAQAKANKVLPVPAAPCKVTSLISGSSSALMAKACSAFLGPMPNTLRFSTRCTSRVRGSYLARTLFLLVLQYEEVVALRLFLHQVLHGHAARA
jgi:hypothetical protein